MKTLKQLEKELCRENLDLSAMIEAELERLMISENLKAARKAAGMTQAQVAERMHVNRAYVAQLEGKPQNVTVSTLVKYANAIGGEIDFKVSTSRKRALA
jgi:DNA-binding XRE family transcriptional regulator